MIESKNPPCLCFSIGFSRLAGVPFCKSIVNGRFRKSSGRTSGRAFSLSKSIVNGRLRKVSGRMGRKGFYSGPCFVVVVVCFCLFVCVLFFFFFFLYILLLAVVVVYLFVWVSSAVCYLLEQL